MIDLNHRRISSPQSAIRDFAAFLRKSAGVGVLLDPFHPLAARGFTEIAPFTLTPFRVRVPSFLCAHIKTEQTAVSSVSLVRHEGLEPPTFAFVVRDSIQLS